ncbi:ankyrin repeat domain-containing protein [uncultured Brachyspira sp.]|uniref:ankyrin repeat domain-containing protein n=1 Tax=uncultured Brachyspira sp. TaxID=221953 RepID=UPI00261CAEDB|nr:ankyrin repeat domain-containing protein [uncultured Brachyspira sp.]
MMKKYVSAILFLLSFCLYSQNITNNNNEEENINADNRLFEAIENGDVNKVKELISGGIDVNSVNSEGWSALHIAVKANNSAILRELLSHKRINMNSKLPADTVLTEGDNVWYADGQTPLLLASYYGYSDIVTMLLNYGADILAKDDIDEAMAIHIAAARGYASVVSAILDSNSAKNSGRDIVNIGDNTGTTPLMWAAMNNQVSIIALLMKYQLDINLQDDDGWTALHFAVASDSYRATEILLRNNADANISDFDGKKPLDICNDTDIEALLNKYVS